MVLGVQCLRVIGFSWCTSFGVLLFKVWAFRFLGGPEFYGVLRSRFGAFEDLWSVQGCHHSLSVFRFDGVLGVRLFGF